MTIVITPQAVQAGPFEDVFRTLKKTFTPQSRRTTSKHKTGTKGDPTATNAAANNTPPSAGNTRSASRASGPKTEKGDYPYGTPVPGKKGFVTSPFAPESGFIDVRDFPPGTPVKDPYTNKIFLTP